MRKLFILIVYLVLLCGKSGAQVLPIKLSTEKPSTGDSITFNYQTTDTFKINHISLKTYAAYSRSLTKTVKFVQRGNLITGAFRVPDSANLLVLAISYADGAKPKGTFFPVYRKGKLMRGANGNSGLIYTGLGAGMFGLPKDEVKALAYYEAEVENYPMDAPTYLVPRISALLALDMKEKAEELLIDAKNRALSNNKTPEFDLYKIYEAYENYIKDEAKAKMIEQQILKKFPNGDMAMSKVINAFVQEKDVHQQKLLYEELVTRFAPVMPSYTKNALNRERARIALVEKDTIGFCKYANLMINPMQQAQMYNSIAWQLAEKGENLHFASDLSKESLVLLQNVLDHPEKQPIPNNSAEPGAGQAKAYYKTYADTYAFICYQLGDKKQAIHYQEQALDGGIGSAEVNQRYVRYLKALGNDETLLSFSKKAIIEGKANDSLESDFKQIYLKKYPLHTWEPYLGALQAQFIEKLREQLKEEMIKESAPPFTLMNLAGQQVSLASLKGKVVIVDFWATWCEPCKASFPGMQNAVNQYKDAPDVAFLFINTLERGDDREMVVKDYMASSGYTFNVLMDNESKKEKRQFDVVSAFGVRGIPAKFVLDKEGNIRFKAAGFSGSNDEELKKISLMVDILRTGEL